jgi:hypothetical protein
MKTLGAALGMHSATSKMHKSLASSEGRGRKAKEPPTVAQRTASALKSKQAAAAKRLLKKQATAELQAASPDQYAAKEKPVPRQEAAAAPAAKTTIKAKAKKAKRAKRAKPKKRKPAGSESEESEHSSSADYSSVSHEVDAADHSQPDDPTTPESGGSDSDAPLMRRSTETDTAWSLMDLARVGVVWAWAVQDASVAGGVPALAIVDSVLCGRGDMLRALECQYLTPAVAGQHVGLWKRCLDASTQKAWTCRIVGRRASVVDVVAAADVHCAVEWRLGAHATEDWTDRCTMTKKEWANVCKLCCVQE